jgi:DnaK suppressor protein
MTHHPHIDAELSQQQTDELAKILATKRSEFVEALTELDRQITTKEDCSVADAAEAASLQENRARASGISQQHSQTIAEIDLALKRLETGRYGISELSGEPIAYERLRLIPWARTGAGE